MHLVSIGLGTGFLPVQRQASTWTIAGLLNIRLLQTNFSEMFVKIQVLTY